jgi:dihydrofolate reductase
MREIVYYVATSLDGFISGPDNDISGFVNQQDSNGIQRYYEDLKKFDTVIMGRKTYEFGYAYGLIPGQPAYPHMRHYIFSSNLSFENAADNVKVYPVDIEKIRMLKEETGTPIYLCGGGEMAGWLLENEMIETLKVKLNPVLLGDGIKLFGDSKKQCGLSLVEHDMYDFGLQINTYSIKY